MKINGSSWLAGGLLILGAAGTGLDAQAGIKCWTNKDGVRECGNVVPPEYAQKGHAELSNSGITIKETAAAKSPEVLEREKREAAEREQRERMRKQQETRQTAIDRVLLHTYTSEDEIQLTLKGKLEAIESRIKLAQNRVEKLEANLGKLREEAAQEERGGQSVSEQLKKNILQVERQIGSNQQYIKERRADQQVLREKSAQDLQRFRDLKSGRVRVGQVTEEP